MVESPRRWTRSTASPRNGRPAPRATAFLVASDCGTLSDHLRPVGCRGGSSFAIREFFANCLIAASHDTDMRANLNRPRLVLGVNSSIALGFLQGQLQYFQQCGFDVTVLCPKPRRGEWEVPRPDGVPIVDVPMERGISPWRDFVSLCRLWRTMRSLRGAVTKVGRPKAGLLGGLAAWLNRVPCRFYTLHGLRFETTKGLRRRLLVFAERLACRLAHRVVCVSHSVREKAVASGLASRERTVVLGSGSCNGVDASRFAATPRRMRQTAELRHQLRIPARAPAALFVGRLT